MGEATDRLAAVGPAALPKDLMPRALSAVVMAVVALGCNWLGSFWFSGLVLVIGLAMSWEWARIVRGGAIDAALVVHWIAVLAAIVLAAAGFLALACAAVVIGVLIVAGLGLERHAALSAFGVAYVGLPAIALIWLRGADDAGALAILFIFVVVWTTDTFAYICGRAIGGPKLWPAMSPSKTWAGTMGGVGFAALAGIAFAMAMRPPSAPLVLAAVAVLLSVVSQIGDLGESALKRAFSVKDASQLIPGHGGFMDRMDGVVTAASLAALLALARSALSSGQTPAQALLFWS